jgi:hypothetical protein
VQKRLSEAVDKDPLERLPEEKVVYKSAAGILKYLYKTDCYRGHRAFLVHANISAPLWISILKMCKFNLTLSPPSKIYTVLHGPAPNVRRTDRFLTGLGIC